VVSVLVITIEELDCPCCGRFMSSTIEWFLNLTYDLNLAKHEPEVIYGKWSVQASKQANIHTHGCNEVTLVWGSLKLAPINHTLPSTIR